jgi:TRAP-type C4-dicarboxylate transport system substrate-binding protein
MMRISSIAAGMVLALTVSVPAWAQKWDMPMAYPATNYHTQNGAAFGKCVAEATGGKLNIVTHPNGSLFAGNDIKRAVQTGQAPIGERLLSAHANENPLFGVDSIPFLATSFADSAKLWKAAEPKVAAALEKQNLVFLYAVPWPPQGFYFKKPVASVADMKGIKFRAYNAATARISALAGMVPVQIEAAELSQALATGVAESFISSGSTGVDSKVWESLKFFYDVQAWLPKNLTMVNQRAWASLDDATRAAVTKASEVAEARGWAESERLANFYLDEFKKNGMTVAPPSAALKGGFQRWGEELTKDWLSRAGADGQALVAAYKASA